MNNTGLSMRRNDIDPNRIDKVVEPAAATQSPGPANQGSAMLKALRDKETGT